MSKALTPSDGKKTKSGFLLSDGLTPRSPNVSRNSSLSSPHTSAKKPSSDPRQTNAATPDSNEALQEPEQPVEPGEHQLFLEDIVKQGKKLMLVKIPPGVDVSSLIGKKLSSKKSKIRAKKHGRKAKVNLTVDWQEPSEELNKWAIFFPSNKDEASYRFVRQRLEGSITLSYSGSEQSHAENTSNAKDSGAAL